MSDTLRILFDDSPVAMAIHRIVFDDQGHPVDYIFLEANSAFGEHTGLNTGEILGRAVTEVIPGIRETPFIDLYGTVVTTGTPISFEQYSAPLGRTYSINAYRTGPDLFVTLFTDISPRKKAEESARAALQRLEGILENTPAMIAELTPDGRCRRVNPAAVRILETSALDLIGRPVAEVLPGPVARRTNAHIRQVVKTGRPVTAEESFRSSDGFPRHFYSVFFPLDSTDGNVASIGVITQDITDRKQQWEERARLQVQLEQAQELANLGSWEYHAATDTLTWSRQTYEIFGLNAENFRESYDAFLETVHPEDRRDVQAAYSQSVEDPDSDYDIRHRIIRHDTGEVRHVHQRCIHERDSSGAVIRSVGAVQDITDLVRGEARMRQAARMESVGHLAGGVAHDFNNMLQVITGAASIAMEDVPPDSPVVERMQEILEAARRSRAITRQLLTFARQDEASPNCLDMNRSIQDMLRMINRLIGEHIEVKWTPSEDLWSVYMDPVHVDQILANLCLNARDAMSGGGEIRISTANVTVEPAAVGPAAATEQPAATKPAAATKQPAAIPPGDYVELTITDTGHGMDAATAESAFDPFFTSKPDGQGTGLGLPTVYGIVTQSHGYITMDTAPGMGTSFRIHIPRREGSPGCDRSAIDATVPQYGTETVLVVEDEATVLKQTTRMLEKRGYRVLAAGSAREALDLVRTRQDRIDLLLTDLIMPEMNGLALAHQLRTVRPGIKALYMSGHTADALAKQGITGHQVECIRKPFSLEDLERHVRESLVPVE